MSDVIDSGSGKSAGMALNTSERVHPSHSRLIAFATPSTFGESFDDDDPLILTQSGSLPEIGRWSFEIGTAFLEILAGRRRPAQIAERCHPVVMRQLLLRSGRESEVGKIQRLHHDMPFDGLCESVATVRFSGRVRPLIIRAEGINGRWLCTALKLMP